MARKLGTGKATDNSASRKWASGVKTQVNSGLQKGINARYVSLSQISLDENNPRQLELTPKQVTEIALAVPLKKQWIDEEQAKEQWWEEYVASLSEHLTGKGLQDFQELALLALSIKRHDRLLNPVTTYPSESGSQLKLIAGERRYLAHLILGETVIATRILPAPPNDLEKDILQWEENNQRLDLTLYEKLLNLQRLLKGWEEEKGAKLSVSQMVSLAGLPRVTAHRYLTVIRCKHKKLMAAIEKQQITSLRKAAELAVLSSAELELTLNPSKKTTKPQALVKIRRSKNYTPIKKILTVASESLATEALLDTILSLDLETAEGISHGFDLLTEHLATEVTD